MNKTIVRDIILVAVILAVSLSLILITRTNAKDGKELVITVDGGIYGAYPLDKDARIEINGAEGKLVVMIEDGKAFVVSSTCAGQDCVHSKPVSHAGERIICLPNRVILQIKGDNGADVVI